MPTTDSDGVARGDPAVDVTVIDALIEDLGDGGAADVVDLILTYLDDCEREMAALGAAAAGGDPGSVRSLAHKMQSSTALLGAEHLASLLRDVGAAAGRDDPALGPAADLVAVEYRRVASEMAAMLPRLTPTPPAG